MRRSGHYLKASHLIHYKFETSSGDTRGEARLFCRQRRWTLCSYLPIFSHVFYCPYLFLVHCLFSFFFGGERIKYSAIADLRITQELCRVRGMGSSGCSLVSSYWGRERVLCNSQNDWKSRIVDTLKGRIWLHFLRQMYWRSSWEYCCRNSTVDISLNGLMIDSVQRYFSWSQTGWKYALNYS